MYNVAIIGAGPAGIFTAGNADERQRQSRQAAGHVLAFD